MSAITVAIAGATGHIGNPMVRAFLSPKYFPSQIKRVIAFTRDPNSKNSQELKALGAELSTGGISAAALKGVDVAINHMPTSVSPEDVDAFASAAAEAGVKVFFPTEFGLDHYTYKFVSDQAFEEKRRQDKYAREVGGGRMKVVAVQTGAWLEFTCSAIGQMLGLDVQNRLFSAPGSVDNKLSLTSMDDVTSSTVRLAIMAAQDPTSVPDHVTISGDAKSWTDLAALAGKELGYKIDSKAIPMDEYMQTVNDQGFIGYLRLYFACDGVDYSQKNDNELVNPAEKFWKWKQAEDYVKETGGKF